MTLASWFDGALLLLLIAAAGLLLAKTWRGLRAAMRVLRRRTRKVATVRSGASEVQGKIHAREATVTSLAGIECVAINTRAWVLVGFGKNARWVPLPARHVERVPTLVRDASGEIDVELDAAAIVGPIYRHEGMCSELRSERPALAAELLKPPANDGISASRWLPAGARWDFESQQVRVDQQVVPNGSHVVINGSASVAGSTGGTGYRDATPKFALRTTDDDVLLVFAGSHTRALARSFGPALVTGFAAAGILGLAVALVALSTHGASVVRDAQRSPAAATRTASP